MTIPKRLHFTWKTEVLPPALRRCYDSFVRTHAGWDIVLWTDANMRAFIAERFPELLAIYDGYGHNIQRADFFRYAVLYAEGGVYADLDIEAFAPIDELLALDCFVGVEPMEHVGDHRREAGVRYLISNAFMGSVQGHPFWRGVMDLAATVAPKSNDIFLTTGPLLLLAAALRAPATERPTGVLAELWSPLVDGGGKTRTSAEDIALLERRFKIHRGCGEALVSHKWLSTWTSWTSKHQHIIERYHPTLIKWWFRRRLHRALAKVRMPLTGAAYDDQRLEGERRDLSVHVGLHLPEGKVWNPILAEELAGLDYPRELLSVTVYGTGGEALAGALREKFGTVESDGTGLTGAALHNHILGAGAAKADRVLLVDGSLTSVPSNSLVALISSGPQLVTATLPRIERPEAYRYGRPLNFRDLYKAGALKGVVSADRGGRHEPREWPAFRLLPVDGLSARFLLVDSEIARKGVRFAETPYKFHLDGEGLTLMAKDLGYEAAIRNDILVA